jgi:hypothetical protein
VLSSLRFYIRIKHEQLLDQQLLALEFITAIKQAAGNRDQSTKKKKKIMISDLLAIASHRPKLISSNLKSFSIANLHSFRVRISS